MQDKMPGFIWNNMLKYLEDQLHYSRESAENAINADRECSKLDLPPQMHHAVLNVIDAYRDKFEESKPDEKIITHKPKRFKLWAALAASLILVLGVSVNTFGTKDYVMSVVKTMRNDKLSVQVSRGDTGGPMEGDTKEEDSIDDINSKLGIKQAILSNLPYLMGFSRYAVDVNAKTAYSVYKGTDEDILTYTIAMNKIDVDDSLKIEHRLLQEYDLQVGNHNISIRELKNEETNEKQFIATFTDGQAFYTLASNVSKKEFDRTIKNIIFLD